MARGGAGAFGGKVLDSVAVWFGLCAVFPLGPADSRRPLSLRNFDLLVLVSFSASLWFFNRGEIFTSVPLAYPPLVYSLPACTAGLLAAVRRRRGGRSGLSGCSPRATVFLAGLRIASTWRRLAA